MTNLRNRDLALPRARSKNDPVVAHTNAVPDLWSLESNRIWPVRVFRHLAQCLADHAFRAWSQVAQLSSRFIFQSDAKTRR